MSRDASPEVQNVIVVTRKTELDELVARFNTRGQARFYLEHAGHSFERIEAAHETHQAVLARVRQAIPKTSKQQWLDRDVVPQFTFAEDDLIVIVGQDGLVSNTAKYLSGQPILAVNPDPARFDGVLLPFTTHDFQKHLLAALNGQATTRQVTLARATLSDGQTLCAFNDFFIGARSHVSARYRIAVGDRAETQSSSGIIVSTGAGSTGWLQSVYAGATGVIEALGGSVTPPANGGRLAWDADRLVYSVREPFPSRATGTSIVHGMFEDDAPLRVSSMMASGGVIFSDGVEADYLDFNTGAELTITTAPRKASLIVAERGVR